VTRRSITTTTAGMAVLVALALIAPQSGAQENDGFAVAKGRTTFRTYCASCHGEEADGRGPVAQYLSIVPADLTVIADRYGEFPTERVREIIDGRQEVRTHGSREMPIWGDIFRTPLVPSGTPEDPEERSARIIDELVRYLRSIQVSD